MDWELRADERARIDLVYGETADKVFAAATIRAAARDVSAPVMSPEHLAMMKGQAMKNRPARVSIDWPDVCFLLSLPEIDRGAVRLLRESVC